MPFDVIEAINSIADWMLRAPIVQTMAGNPIYMALAITFIIMLTILFVFRDATTDDSLLVMTLRSGFWVFLMLLGLLFLHNKVLLRDVQAETRSAAYDTVFTPSYTGQAEDMVVPVHINTNFTVPAVSQ